MLRVFQIASEVAPAPITVIAADDDRASRIFRSWAERHHPGGLSERLMFERSERTSLPSSRSLPTLSGEAWTVSPIGADIDWATTSQLHMRSSWERSDLPRRP